MAFLIEFQDAAEEIKDSPLRKTTPEMEKNDAESGLSLSSTEERDLRSSQEGSPIIQGHKCKYTQHISVHCMTNNFLEKHELLLKLQFLIDFASIDIRNFSCMMEDATICFFHSTQLI